MEIATFILIAVQTLLQVMDHKQRMEKAPAVRPELTESEDAEIV